MNAITESYRGYTLRDVGHSCFIKKGDKIITAQADVKSAKEMVDRFVDGKESDEPSW